METSVSSIPIGPAPLFDFQKELIEKAKKRNGGAIPPKPPAVLAKEKVDKKKRSLKERKKLLAQRLRQKKKINKLSRQQVRALAAKHGLTVVETPYFDEVVSNGEKPV